MAFLTFVLRHALPHKFLDKSNWEGLVRGEVDGAFGGGEALKFVLEGLDHRRGREQTAVVRKRGEPHQHSVVLERRNPVADRLGGFRWHNGANRRAKLLQGVAPTPERPQDTHQSFSHPWRLSLPYSPSHF